MAKKFSATVNNQTYELRVLDGKAVEVNGKTIDANLAKIRDGLFSLILDGVIYIIGSDPNTSGLYQNGASGSAKVYYLTVNGYNYTITLDDEHSLLLKSLLKENTTTSTVTVIRAPMPGLIVKVEVEEGQQVQQGQGVVILEAMKMENEIKALSNGIIKTIHVQPRKAVEKGEALVSFVQA